MTVKSMNTNEDKKVELEIEVDAETFGKAVDASYKKNVKRMQIPGFRKGKAPRKMIEKFYGENVFFEDAVNDTIPEAYDAAVKEKGIEPVERPKIEVNDVTAQGYTFKATVSVKPEVQVKEYKGLSVEKTIHKVTDEVVEKQLEQRREQSARMVNAGEREAQMGDTAVIDFDGSMDGVPFEGGKGEKFPLELGSGSFIPGFEEQVVGKKAGEEFDVNVTFPENYHVDTLKNKPAVFKCKLNEVLVKELPALDDEFAKDVSEFDTLDELKEDIRKKLQEKFDDDSQTDVENKLLEQVCNEMEADIPVCMYEGRIDDMVREFEYRLQNQGMNLPTYLQYMGMDKETFRESFRERAELLVKTRLALEAIAEAEKIEPTEAEINEEYENIAKNYKIEVERARKIVSESELKKNLAMGKALDIVRDSAKVTEVEADDKAEKAEEEKGEEKPKRTAKAKTEETAEKPKRTRKKAKEPAEDAQ